ncbi:hypothetical protein HDV00_007568 [Rhizophlyctis rosea]|nr:hypothetical protein HDV00_007568 [Rhizophlyctis rosea]
MTSDDPTAPLTPSLSRLLSDLSRELSENSDPDPESLESLESLDISKILKQMDMANSVMDSIESRTDALVSKLDAMIEQVSAGFDNLENAAIRSQESQSGAANGADPAEQVPDVGRLGITDTNGEEEGAQKESVSSSEGGRGETGAEDGPNNGAST